MKATGAWQVWDCGDLVETFPDLARAEACRTDLLDDEAHNWPHLADLASRCITIVHVHQDDVTGRRWG